MWGIFSLLLLLIVGCNYRIEKATLSSVKTEDIDFSFIKENIFRTKCLTCHSSEVKAGFIDLDSYASLLSARLVIPKNAKASPLYQSVEAGRMPKKPLSPLSAAEKDVLQRWIENGAPEVKGKQGELSKPKPTFSWLKQNIFESRCQRCHDSSPGKKLKGDTDLSSYEKLLASEGVTLKPVVPKKPEESSLYTAVESGDMPPVKDSKLSEEEIKVIFDWIANGALNN